MIKHILINFLFAELLYLLIKPLIVKLESEDEIDTINTFNEHDYADLKGIVAEVSE